MDRVEASVVYVHGLPGVGTSSLVRRAAADYASLVHTCPPLPDPEQRALLAQRVEETLGAQAGGAQLSPDASWSEILGRVLEAAARSGHPFVLVLDDAHRLTEARSRVAETVRGMITKARARAVALHVVMAGRRASLPDIAAETGSSAPAAVHVEPLGLRAAAPLLPGSRAYDKVRAYGVFGGVPRVLAQLDTTVTVGTNVRRLVLDDSGPLADAPLAWIEREVQTPSRYVSILRTLARGEADWSTIHDGVPDLTRSGQVAPYLARLMGLGMIESRRSLDASPRSRGTRYAIADPFLAFWFRFALPWRQSEPTEAIGPYYARVVRPGVLAHMEQMLPSLARRHMAHDAVGTLGTASREAGSLWSTDVDIPVAGTLTSGAVYYGECAWASEDSAADGASLLARLDRSIGATRYGFGRERRLRLLFMGSPPDPGIRRDVARRDDARLLGPEDLLGE